MHRYLVVALAIVAASSSFASYEVLLVSDAATKSVHRFDPISGAYLGNFGGGYLTGAMDVAVNQTLGLAYVRENSSTVRAFDYSTGLPVAKYTIGGSDIDVASDGSLLTWTSNTQISHFSGAGAFIENWSAPAGSTFAGVAMANPGYVATWRFTGGTQEVVVYKFGTPTAYSVTSSSGYGTTVRSVSGNANGFFSVSNDSSPGKIANFTVMQSGVYTGSFGFSTLGTSLFTITGAAIGHGSYAYACGISLTDITKGAITRYDYNAYAGSGLSTFGSGYLVSPTGMASVVAPEPATFVVLGLGVLALRRRRR